MVAACQFYGSKLAINHSRRFSQLLHDTKLILESEEFGEFTSMTVVSGNCGLSMNGSHYIEQFLYLAGEKAKDVRAWLTPQHVTNPRGSQYEDHAGQLLLTTESGKRLYMEVGHDQAFGETMIYGGRNGQLYVDALRGDFILDVRQAVDRDLPTTRACEVKHTVQHVLPIDSLSPIRAVLNALLFTGETPCPKESRHVIEVLAAAYASDEKGGARVELEGADAFVSDRTFAWA